MKKSAVLLLSFLLCAPAAFAAEDDKAEQKQAGAPTYESPILSLLFLPVNLLIKMASITGPSSTSSTANPTASSGTGK